MITLGHVLAAAAVLFLMALSHLAGVVLERRRETKLALRHFHATAPMSERERKYHSDNSVGR